MTEKPKSIYKSLVTVCAEVENVKRDTSGQVGNSKYKYATIDAVLEVVQPLLKANGLALVQYVEDDAMVATLYHEGGESLPMGRYNLGVFVDSQKRGSAITYARRYQLCSIFGIAQEDDDGKADARDKPAGNPPTNGEKTAQAEFGTATEFKKYYNETMEAIKRLPSKDDAAVIRKRIERIQKVDDQYGANATDALELRLDDLHMQG